jgi:RecA-family ATPase
MRVVQIRKFVQEETNIDWLVEGLLPSTGWTLFAGVAGLGKSTFAAQLCDSLQQGTEFLGRKTRQTNTMFVQADGSADEWREMLKRISPASTGLTVVEVPQQALSNVSYAQQIQGAVEKYNPGFVVFDSLYNLTSVSINTEAVLLPVNTMKQICQHRPFLLIHHPPNDETRASGHHSLRANCSNEWFMLNNRLKINKGRLVKDKQIVMERDNNGLWGVKNTGGTRDELMRQFRELNE